MTEFEFDILSIRFKNLLKMTCKGTTNNLNKQIKEEKICTFTQKGTRLQLVKIYVSSEKAYYHYETKSYDYYREKFEVRLNRKIIDKSLALYPARKVFAQYVQNIVLPFKID